MVVGVGAGVGVGVGVDSGVVWHAGSSRHRHVKYIKLGKEGMVMMLYLLLI